MGSEYRPRLQSVLAPFGQLLWLRQLDEQLPGNSKTYLTNNAYVYANQLDTKAYSDYRPNHPTWLTDSDIVSEIKRVGIGSGDSHNAQINVFLSQGESVCTDNNGTPSNCFPGAGGCGYHRSLNGSDGSQYAYSLIPFGHSSSCDVSNPPNGHDTDTALTVLSHESFEQSTDPSGGGWYNPWNGEVADLCAWQMGTLSYDGGKANHAWGQRVLPLTAGVD